VELPAIAAAAAATAAATATTTATTAAIAATTAVVTAATTAAAVATATAAITAAATTIATTAATTTTAAAVTTTAATAAAARLALLGLVDAERATVEGVPVHALDRLRGFLGGAHGDEREAARAARLAVAYEVDVADRSEFLERRADAFSIGVE